MKTLHINANDLNINIERYFIFKCVNYKYKNLTKSCFEYDIFE